MENNLKCKSGKAERSRLMTLAAVIALVLSVLLLCTSCGEHECSFDIENPIESALATEATCTEKATYYYSCECGELGEETFEYGDIAYHSLTHKLAVNATAARPGNIEYWICSKCNNYFSDSYGKNMITDKSSVIIPATGEDDDNDKHTCVYDKQITSENYLATEASCSGAALYYYSCECGEAGDATFAYGEPLDHTVAEVADSKYLANAADCDSAATYYKSCSVCGEKSDETFVYGEALAHAFAEKPDSKYLVSAATCQSMAIYYKSCSVCGEASDITFRAPGFGSHNYVGKVDVKNLVSDADCDTPAIYYKSCSVCGEVSKETFEYGEALGHNLYNYPKNEYLISSASCTAAAVYYKSCSVCGEKSNQTFTYGSTVGHNYIEKATSNYLVSAADCKTPATYNKSCSVCGVKGSATFTSGSLGSHNNIKAVKDEYLVSAADCKTLATYNKSCSVCGEAGSETFTAGELAACNPILSEGECETATCTENGFKAYRCSVCNALTTISVEASGHDFDANPGLLTEVNCQHGEYTTYTCANGCGETDIVYNEEKPALAHNPEMTDSAEPSCTEPGFEKYECSYECGYTYTTPIDATGHDDVSATCTADAYCHCEALVEAATGHSMSDSPCETNAPTCLTDGWVMYKCTADGCEYTETDVPTDYLKTGHNVTEWFEEQLKDADIACTYTLITYGYCKNTGCENENSYVSISGEPDVKHNYVWEVTEEATCVASGKKKNTCTVCGYYEEDIEYSADGVAHKWDEGVEVEGSVVYTCINDGCGKTKVEAGKATTVSGDALKNEMQFYDASLSLDETLQGIEGEVNLSVGKTDSGVNKDNIVGAGGAELTEEEKGYIDAGEVYEFTMTDADGLPIDFGGGKITVKIPYTLDEGDDPDDITIWYLAVKIDEEMGDPIINPETNEFIYELTYTEAVYVIIDGQGYAVFEAEHFSYYTVTKMSPAQRCGRFGHNFLTQEISATCMSDGYTLNTCMRCGEKVIENYVEALGHDWEYNNITPDCINAGANSATCSRCFVTFTETVPPTGHDWEVINTVSATCTSAGYTDKKCSACGIEVTTDKVDSLGHLNEVRVTEPNCQRGGYTEHYCGRCGTVYLIDNETEKTDHDWNVENPDCEKDKFCRHCNAIDKNSDNNGKAKGHKYDENGNCEHCEKKCDHNKKVFSYDKAPSCASFGSKIYHCPDCQMDIDGERIPKEAHRFKGGVCVVCGAQEELETSSDFYTNIVKTFFSADGFSVKIENLTYIYEELSGLNVWFVNGAVSQIDVAELMLYIDGNGNLAGAGYGSFVITNGIKDGDVTVSFELLIENGYIYINAESEYKLLNLKLRYTFSEFAENVLSEVIDDEILMLLGFAKSDLVPLLITALEHNSAEVEGLLESVFDMLFSYEIVDGEYEFFLDYDKLYALMENLATLSVSEVVDLYFGEGAYEDVKAFVYELMALTVSDIPSFVEDKLGISEADLIAFLNNYCKLIGAPDDFDITDIFASDNAKKQTIGDILADGEDYVELLDSLFDNIEKYTILGLGGEDVDKDEFLKNVKTVLDGLEAVLSVGFSIDKDGNAKDVSVSVEPTVITSGSTWRDKLGIDINVIINGIIDIDFGDMSEDIDSAIDMLPTLDDDESYRSENYDHSMGAFVEYNGEWYEVDIIVYNRLVKNLTAFSVPDGYAIYEHCGDWLEYNLFVSRESYYYFYTVTYISELDLYLVYDNAGNTFAFTEENGIAYGTAYNGEEVSFELTDNALFTYEQLMLCFGELDFEFNYKYSMGKTVYFNTVTGEVSYDSMHKYELTDSKAAVSCGEDGYDYYVCTECGDSYYDYYNSFEHSYEFDMENSNIPTECETSGYKRYTCTECGDWYNMSVWKAHNERFVYSLHEGAKECADGLDCKSVCTDCGMTLWIRENYIFGHTYVREWTLEGDVLASTTACAVCKNTLDSNFRYKLESIFDTEVINPDGDHPYLKFTPDVSGIYELFSKENNQYSNNDMWARLYDENMLEIAYSDDDAEGMHFGILCNLEAGKTYYLKVGFYSYQGDSDTSICIRAYDDSKNVAIPLSEYGCTCGTVMMLMYQFDTVEVVEQKGEGKCALEHYGYGWDYESDESCNEICNIRYEFYNPETGEDFVVTVYSYYTGKISHSDVTWEWFEESGTVTDENGNELRFDNCGVKIICYACGSVIEKSEEIRYYNENGECVRAENNNYESDAYGELYLASSSVGKYEIHTDNNGNVSERVISDAEYQYDGEGNVTFWMERTFTYEGCRVIRETKSSNGKNDIEEFLEHRESEKLLDKECSEEEIDGLLVITTTYENYCTECAASIEKRVVVDSYDADGNCVKSEWSLFVPYAVSETEGGWRLNRSEVRTYATVTNSLDSKLKRSVTLTEEYINYDEIGNATWWIKYTYEYKNGGYCEYNRIYYDVISDYEFLEEENAENHYYTYYYKLSKGSETCTDGLDQWNICTWCGYEYLHGERWSYEHSTVEYGAEKIYSSDFGAQCGGYMEIRTCPCGERRLFNTNNLNCEIIYDGYDEYYYNPSEGIYNYYLYTYGCAVTHTADGYSPCGFEYTYECWWSLDESCRRTYHYRYVIGTNTDNPYTIEWSESDEGDYWHPETEVKPIDGSYRADGIYEIYTEGNETYCVNCGMKTGIDKHDAYVKDGKVVKIAYERIRYNNDGSYYVQKNVNEVFCNEELDFNSAWEETYYSYGRCDADGTLCYIDENIYEKGFVYNLDKTNVRVETYKRTYNSYSSIEEFESGKPRFSETWVYDYSDCACNPSYIYENSNGEYDEGRNNYDSDYYGWHYSWLEYWVTLPTCTQSGTRALACNWCDGYEYTWEHSPFGHSYDRQEDGSYICSRCDLQNFTGYDGSIVLEDLTWKVGNGESYVIGYYLFNKVEYSIYVSLIIDDGTEFGEEYMLNAFFEMKDTGSMLYININDLVSAIDTVNKTEGTDYSICTNMIRISFVPVDDTYDCDYAITLDPHVLSYTADEAEEGAASETHSAECVFCDYVKKSENCRYYNSYEDTKIINGVRYDIYELSCRHCDNFCRTTEWEELTDEKSCEYTAYRKTEWLGGEKTEMRYTDTRHKFEYTFDSVTDEYNSFNPQHNVSACVNCGYVEDKTATIGYCEFNGQSFDYVDENGKTIYVSHNYCYDCGFSYKLVYYYELKNAESCEYDIIHIYYWGYLGDGVYENTMNGKTGTTDIHNYTEFTHIYGDTNSFVPETHCAICADCGNSAVEYCNFNSDKKNVEIDGVSHSITTYNCMNCGFEYTRDVWDETVSDCGYIQHCEFNWYRDGELVGYSSENDYSNHSYAYSFTENSGVVTRTRACSKCGLANGSFDATVTVESDYTLTPVLEGTNYCFAFAVTVTEDAYYSFYSVNSSDDTYGYIYDSNGNLMLSDDDSGDYNNFAIEVKLNAGETYYLVARFLSEPRGGSYTVVFETSHAWD